MKRLIKAVCIVLVLNMLGLAVLAGLAWNKGWLAPERVRLAFDALRNEPGQDAEGDAAVEAVAVVDRGLDAGGEETIRIRRAELERREREIQHAWQYLESQQLAFLREKESFDAYRTRVASEEAARRERSGEDGFKRELAYYAGMKSKLAKELLRNKTDADVIRLLKGLDLRAGKKIVGQCKTQEEREWIGRILGMLKDSDVTQAEALVADAKTNRNP